MRYHHATQHDTTTSPPPVMVMAEQYYISPCADTCRPSKLMVGMNLLDCASLLCGLPFAFLFFCFVMRRGTVTQVCCRVIPPCVCVTRNKSESCRRSRPPTNQASHPHARLRRGWLVGGGARARQGASPLRTSQQPSVNRSHTVARTTTTHTHKCLSRPSTRSRALPCGA